MFTGDMVWNLILACAVVFVVISFTKATGLLGPLWLFIAVTIAAWCYIAQRDGVSANWVPKNAPDASDQIAYAAYYGKIYRDLFWSVCAGGIVWSISSILAIKKVIYNG